MNHQMIARQAILVGLAALLPIPFIDIWLQGRLRAELTRGLARHHDVAVEPETVRVLSAVKHNLLVGCVLGVFWWPIKKLLRKIVYILAVKDAFDALADTLIRGWMLDHAFARGLPSDSAPRVREAMDEALGEHARSPLWGPRTSVSDAPHIKAPPDTHRVLLWIARRGGADASLARFEVLLDTPRDAA